MQMGQLVKTTTKQNTEKKINNLGRVTAQTM